MEEASSSSFRFFSFFVWLFKVFFSSSMVSLRQQAREIYQRDDIFGAFSCKSYDTSAARLSSLKLLVVDTNVVLHQIDLLENPTIDNVVVLSVVLDEVKNMNRSVYNRIRALCSNPAWEMLFVILIRYSHMTTGTY